MINLMFDEELQASDKTDLQSMMPGFNQPKKKYLQAIFRYHLKEFQIHISNWLKPRHIKLGKPIMTFAELYQIVEYELQEPLSAQEKINVFLQHEKLYGEKPPVDMYKTRKDAFDPNEHPNWHFSQKPSGHWILEASN